MRSLLHRVRRFLSIPALMLLVAAPSACTTTQVLGANQCFTQMVGPSLREPTPHADAPVSATAGAWVDQANKEAGQTDKANARADTIIHIGDTCDAWRQQAKEAAEKHNLANAFGLDLEEETRAKFNKTSAANGFPHRI